MTVGGSITDSRPGRLTVQSPLQHVQVLQILAGLDVSLIVLRLQVMGQVQIGQVNGVGFIASAQRTDVMGNSGNQLLTVFLGGKFPVLAEDVKTEGTIALTHANGLDLETRQSDTTLLIGRGTACQSPPRRSSS